MRQNEDAQGRYAYNLPVFIILLWEEVGGALLCSVGERGGEGGGGG